MVDVSEGKNYAFDFSEYDEAKTRNSLRQHNYNRNAAYNSIVSIHNVAVKNPSREAAEQVEEFYEKYKRSTAACEAAHHHILTLKKEYEGEWDKELAALVKQRQAADKCALTVFGLGRPTATGPKKDEVCKAVDALKPPILTATTTPTSFTIWKVKFKAYYQASKMHRATNEEQHQYLYSCLEDDLYQRIRHKIDAKVTPIFIDPESNYKAALVVLTDEFAGLFPLAMRRMEWISHKYAGSWASYYSKMRQLAAAADYHNMTADDYLAFTLLANIPHGEMRSEMLRLQHPGPVELDNIGRQYDRAGAVQAHMSAAGTPKVMATKQQGGGGKKKGAASASGGESVGFRKWKQLEAQGKCGRCASADHVSADCVHKKAKCTTCQKIGHTSRACQQTAAAKALEDKDNVPKLPMLGFEGNDDFTPRVKTAKAAKAAKPKSRATPPLGL